LIVGSKGSTVVPVPDKIDATSEQRNVVDEPTIPFHSPMDFKSRVQPTGNNRILDDAAATAATAATAG
jgi:hypothetical protein